MNVEIRREKIGALSMRSLLINAFAGFFKFHTQC